MEIAFIHPTYPGGEGSGTTYTATQLVKGLTENGFETTVYCLQSPEQDKINHHLINYVNVGEGGFLSHPTISPNKILKKRLEEFRNYDIVHSYPMKLFPLLSKIGENESVKTVLSLNGYRPVCPKNDLRYMDSENCRSHGVLRCSSCILSTSTEHYVDSPFRSLVGRFGNFKLIESVKSGWDNIDQYHVQAPHMIDIFSKFELDTGHISIIPNILDERFDVDHASNFNEPFKLLYVGDLHQRKGVHRIPKIVHTMKDRGVDFHFTIIGEGEMYETVQRRSTSLGVSELITLKGRIPYTQLPAEYANHDLFIYPGLWDEPFARVFLEAMATGTPILATDVGSTKKILGDSGIISDKSPQSIGRTIIESLKNRNLEELSSEADQRVQQYKRSNVINMMVDNYKNIL